MQNVLSKEFFNSVVSQCDYFNARIRELEVRMAELEFLGLVQASLIERAGYKGKVNIYILHRSICGCERCLSGGSRYEYVGADKAKIAIARERVGYYVEYLECEVELKSLRGRLERVAYYLSRVGMQLFGYQVEFDTSGVLDYRSV